MFHSKPLKIASKNLLFLSIVYLAPQNIQAAYPTHDMNFPDGCGNPFARTDHFNDFFESTLSALAAMNGPQGSGVSHLFASNELRKEYEDLQLGGSQENPISLHIQEQLCTFKLVDEQKRGPNASPAISSKDQELHKHLSNIAPMIYRDSRKLYLQAKQIIRNRKAQEGFYRARSKQIKAAAKLGRKKIADLINSD